MTIDILAEPRGAEYHALLQFLGPRSATFALVWSDQLTFAASADDMRIRLGPFERRTERVSEWPGTQLFGSLVTMRHYASSAGALRVLETAEGLYSWQAPALPEDLSFSAPDGRTIFASIAHERDAWFEGDVISMASLRAALTGLELREAHVPNSPAPQIRDNARDR
ncbi:MAG: hypothetical protein M3Z54_13765 [Gemmatimonadota bacterium]|nr:hypothetical protein [Gemmatimonadota bacterium]